VKNAKKRASSPARKAKPASAKRSKGVGRAQASNGKTSKQRKPSLPANAKREEYERQRLIDAAGSQYTSVEERVRLAQAPDPAIRTSVARCRWTQPEAKQYLLHDPCVEVRREFARYAGDDFGPRLLEDTDEIVRGFGVRYAPASLLPVLVKDPSPVVRGWVPKHPDVTLAMLRTLAEDPDPDVRTMVVGAARTSWGILGKCLHDPVEKVRRMAEQELSRGARFCDCCGRDHAAAAQAGAVGTTTEVASPAHN
jgi:hypothetical protein